MRKRFVKQGNFGKYWGRRAAEEQCPWAALIVKVDGGYWCFESFADYEAWRKQV